MTNPIDGKEQLSSAPSISTTNDTTALSREAFLEKYRGGAGEITLGTTGMPNPRRERIYGRGLDDRSSFIVEMGRLCPADRSAVFADMTAQAKAAYFFNKYSSVFAYLDGLQPTSAELQLENMGYQMSQFFAYLLGKKSTPGKDGVISDEEIAYYGGLDAKDLGNWQKLEPVLEKTIEAVSKAMTDTIDWQVFVDTIRAIFSSATAQQKAEELFRKQAAQRGVAPSLLGALDEPKKR